MDIHHQRLRYLVEAIQCGSVRAAADKLGIAPSAISRQIALLEQDLASTLIERHRKGVVATQAGQVLQSYYRRTQAQQEDCLAQLTALKGLQQGHVDLAVGEGFVSDLMHHALPAFQRQYPHLSYHIHSGGSREVLHWIERDEAHIGLLFHPPQHPKIRVQRSRQHPVCAIMPPEHALAEHSEVSLAQLQDQSVALLENHFGVRQLLAMAEFEAGLRLRPHLMANTIAVIKQYVRAGMGVTLLPAFAVAREIQDQQFIARPIDHPLLLRGEVQLITRLGRTLSDAPLALLQQLLQHMQAFKH